MITEPAPQALDPSLDVWNISPEDFHSAGTFAEKLSFTLGYAILAPSGHNTQPWLFAVDDGIELYADRTRALPVIDPEDRELTISCGAALLNLRLALRRFGLTEQVDILPYPEDDDLLARIRVHPGWEPSEEDLLLFDAIPKRHTNRQLFDGRVVAPALLTALQGEADDEGAWLHIVEDGPTWEKVVDMIAGGEVILWADKRFRRELAAWMHPHRRRRQDGIPGYGQGLGDVASLLQPGKGAQIEADSGVVTGDGDQVSTSPILAVLGTDGDAPADWLAAGQALERVLLRAQAAGVSASFLNQPVEVPELRRTLHHVLSRGGFPQLLIRLGYGPEVKPTPRRPVYEVVLP